ncbi:hypothetical protein CJ010_16665 [Azoarcus sp. DD4]|uniref:fumarylacetoacetate hydrolase family protein n=1 Tax=Azoarcus sp. DD4 TaxID=2027405 RepID=UPI00112B4672|nr:fumarylacetoacetate hydrolase family protein [Azoarcus sp. DD4]QDF98050.1 hypothetical protein CJ010_16665 [Azoarcus sp. DD4]
MTVASLPVAGTVYGVVMNDRVSVERLGAAAAEAPYKGAPKAPVLYIKPANTLVGEGAAVRLPAGEARVEVAATVGIVIGAPAARRTPADALETVAGYLLVADLSLPHASYYRPAIREKCFDSACPVAARVVPAAEAGSLARLTLRTAFDGLPVAERTLADLLRDVPQLIADVSEFMTLQTGDVLLVGVEYQSPQAAPGTQVHIAGGALGALTFSIAEETR